MQTNVLFLHTGDDWLRGSEIALLTLLRGLDRDRFNPFLITSNLQLAKAAAEESVSTFVRSMPEIMVDWPDVKLRFGLWARATNFTRAFVRTNDIGLVYCNGASTCQIGYYAAKLNGIPVICHVHSPYGRRYVLFNRLHLASHVIFVSKAVEESVRRKCRFKATSEVVYNGVDLKRFRRASSLDLTWRQALAIPRDAVVFGQVSSLIPRKGIDILLRAFQLLARHCPQSRLVFVGDGPERSEYVRLAESLGIGREVVWTGHQPDPLPYYQHVFDVNVLSSRNDAFPLTLLESAACGIPAIATKVDGIPEAIDHGRTGFLFDREDHEALSQKMLILARDSRLRTDLGRAARARALDHFSEARFCDAIQNAIDKHVRPVALAIQGESSCLRTSS